MTDYCPVCRTHGCICDRQWTIEVTCTRCGEAEAAQEAAADTWARRHRCRQYKRVGWTAEMDAAVVDAASEHGGLRRLAEKRDISYAATQKRAEVLRKRGAAIKPRPPRGRVWTAAEDAEILQAVRDNHVLGRMQKDGGRFGALAERLGVPVVKIRDRSFKIGAKRQVLDELKKSDWGWSPGPPLLGKRTRGGRGRVGPDRRISRRPALHAGRNAGADQAERSTGSDHGANPIDLSSIKMPIGIKSQRRLPKTTTAIPKTTRGCSG